ncbi:acetyltransferase, GNAT family [Bacteriovorax sp. BAL6_X]|uniref:GNAT family N-acetyltransferase n=1 Tax=Bacteriovorax sp. BAL6_X TaxID=1201290 RepID=UPI000386E255|nr:GNAT family N-acetyltransferase [Bacteriovorax sp. BAL6_X]EPZ52329.1 acetyltransferase, GNAT family [Bacteriovorax sp. BAL6_X]
MEALALDHIYDFAGHKAQIREVGPLDKKLLLKGIHEMERKSIYHRFFGAKKGLTAKELINLTEYDKRFHYAIGVATAAGPTQPMGVARFDIHRDNPNTAEFAITIIDKYQGIGVGKELLSLLILEARSRGVKILKGEMLSTNTQMIGLAQSMTKTHGCELKLSRSEQGVQTISLILPC